MIVEQILQAFDNLIEQGVVDPEEKKPLNIWFDGLTKALKKKGITYEKSKISPTDALELYYAKVKPNAAADRLAKKLQSKGSKKGKKGIKEDIAGLHTITESYDLPETNKPETRKMSDITTGFHNGVFRSAMNDKDILASIDAIRKKTVENRILPEAYIQYVDKAKQYFRDNIVLEAKSRNTIVDTIIEEANHSIDDSLNEMQIVTFKKHAGV